MWYKTTEVYRVPLPNAKIDLLNDDATQVLTKVGIFTHSKERSELLISELNKLLVPNDVVKINFEIIEIDQNSAASAKTPALLESIIQLNYPVKRGEFMFLEWVNLAEDVLVTSERSALISKQTSASQIHRVLSLWILRLPKLRSVVNSTVNLQTNDKQRRIVHTSAPPSSSYDVLISVVQPRPDQQNVHWNARAALNAYIQPFLSDVNEVSNFVMKSQWKYQVQFDFTKKQVTKGENGSETHYVVTDENLPHIITSIEGKLGISIHEKPTIHLVVYIPPCDASPLYFTKDFSTNVDSFLSSKWGGVIISNPTKEECSKWMASQEKVDVTVNSHNVMHTALFLLRRIIDIHVNTPISSASIVPWEAITPRSWEVDSHLRISAVHLIASATSTLQSLTQLLDGIRNIVINDDVGLAITDAYANIVQAKFHLKQNHLSEAVAHARRAFESSERAFFDPSLLALLYFPDDQKYAIYIPLFLPVMLPIVMSFASIFKHFRKNKKVKAE